MRAHFTPCAAKTVAEHAADQAKVNAKTDPRQSKAAADQEGANAQTDPGKAKVAEIIAGMKTHPLITNSPAKLPSYISGRNFSLALLSLLRDGSALPVFTQVEATVAKLPEGDLRKTLQIFLSDAGQDIDKFRASLETWFDDAMDRLSGLYKRLSQYALLIVGAILAVALNVNALHLARALWDEDPVTRAAYVAAASAAAAKMDPTQLQQNVQSSLDTLHGLALPIGWYGAPAPGELAGDIAGWAITMVAITLGAPFWFDLLQKIVNLRAAGPKPDPSGGPASN